MTLPEIDALERIVGQSRLIRAQIEKCASYCRSRSPVLICGETGTGKEIFAKAIHCGTFKPDAPFVPVNCAAIPDALVESQLFGHEAGAFTGATRRQKGLIEQAEGGTLFLDEINSLSLLSQSKHLRFLQDCEYRPLGATATRHANARVISGTNEDLAKAVEEGRFRRDLYFRLNVLVLTLPSLRDRPEDIPLIATHLIARHCPPSHSALPKLTSAAMDKLMSYHWPGNARELENVIERSLALCSRDALDAPDLDIPCNGSVLIDQTYKAQKARAIYDFEERYLRQLMARYHENISQAARAAHKDRKSLSRLLHQHGLAPCRASACRSGI